MAINLTDFPAATAAYLNDNVTVTIEDVTSGVQEDELGTYTLRVRNAAAPEGVRLIDVVLHVHQDPTDSVPLLLPPGSALLQPRATNDSDAPRLPGGEAVTEMFVFFSAADGDIEPNATLDVGEELRLDFEYQAAERVRTTINAHIHATVVVDDLFPRGRGSDGSADVTVKR
jgi:hypothetical protein